MSSKKLRKVQLGFESTPGTGVPATAIMRLNGTLEDQREVKFSEEDVGYLSGVDRAYVTKLMGGMVLAGEATFQQLPYILAMSIKNVVDGQIDGTGSDYLYTYPLPTTAENTIKTATIEAGDDQAAEEMNMCYVPSFTLSGAQGEEVGLSADIEGGEVSSTTFTGSLTLDDVETILFQKAKLYLDAIGGSIGTTQVSNTLIGFSLKVNGGKHLKWTGDGDLGPSYVGQGEVIVELEVTFEHNSSAVTEKSNWRNSVSRLLRLNIEGSAFATGGTKYQNHTLRIDLAGKWSKFNKIDEQNGNDVVTGVFVAKYNSTADFFAEIEVANEVSTLP